jgi:FixJ family two-component response regulator
LKKLTEKDIYELPLISIVDDDKSLCESLLRLMKVEGFRAKAFTSAEDFLKSDHLDETACLILDVRLPVMTGLELQSRLLAMNKRIPIIFLTAQSDERAQGVALKAGALAFLSKPFVVDALMRVINSILRRKNA